MKSSFKQAKLQNSSEFKRDTCVSLEIFFVTLHIAKGDCKCIITSLFSKHSLYFVIFFKIKIETLFIQSFRLYLIADL